MTKLITSGDIGDGLSIEDDKLVATGGANSSGGVAPVKVEIPFGNGQPYDIEYDYSNVLPDLDRVTASVTQKVSYFRVENEAHLNEYFFDTSNVGQFVIDRTDKKIFVPFGSVGAGGGSGEGVITLWLFPKANTVSSGAVVTIEDEVAYQSPSDGTVTIYKKYSNMPDYIQTNTASLVDVRTIEGEQVFILKWAFPEVRNGYNSTSNELIVVE